MTRIEAGELLGPSVDEATGAALFEDSGGNPFYLEQLARAVQRTSSLADATRHDSLTDLHVPPRVAAALADELALLSDATCCLLRGAAVAGDPFDPELAAAAAAFDGTSALEAVDELLRLDLIRETDVPRRFRFRHPLVRRAVYESAPGGWRLGAHERCADVLAARGVGPEERAHHVERAGRQGIQRPLQHCATPEMQRPTVPQTARPTGSRSPCDCSPTTPRQEIASRSCSRAQER